MDVGIVVLSLTGNTLHVGEVLQETLVRQGHTATIVRLEPRWKADVLF